MGAGRSDLHLIFYLNFQISISYLQQCQTIRLVTFVLINGGYMWGLFLHFYMLSVLYTVSLEIILVNMITSAKVESHKQWLGFWICIFISQLKQFRRISRK